MLHSDAKDLSLFVSANLNYASKRLFEPNFNFLDQPETIAAETGEGVRSSGLSRCREAVALPVTHFSTAVASNVFLLRNLAPFIMTHTKKQVAML